MNKKAESRKLFLFEIIIINPKINPVIGNILSNKQLLYVIKSLFHKRNLI
jgi:hypothetical protein